MQAKPDESESKSKSKTPDGEGTDGAEARDSKAEPDGGTGQGEGEGDESRGEGAEGGAKREREPLPDDEGDSDDSPPMYSQARHLFIEPEVGISRATRTLFLIPPWDSRCAVYPSSTVVQESKSSIFVQFSIHHAFIDIWTTLYILHV